MKTFLPDRYIGFLRKKLGIIQADPGKIAAGYAAGFLMGALPFMGVRVILALALAIAFKWSKTATLVGVYHINPLTGPPFYIAAFFIGQLLLGNNAMTISPGEWDIQTLIQAFWNDGHFLLVLTTGCMALALLISVFLYLSAYKVISYLQSAHYPPKSFSHEIHDHRRKRLHRRLPGPTVNTTGA